MDINGIIKTSVKKLLVNEYAIELMSDESTYLQSLDLNVSSKSIVCIAFSGSANFILGMCAQEAPLQKIAYAFTGDHDMYDEEIGVDSLKELINIIAGHILREFSYEYNAENIGISTPFLFSNDLLNLYKKCNEITFSAQCGVLKLFYFH